MKKHLIFVLILIFTLSACDGFRLPGSSVQEVESTPDEEMTPSLTSQSIEIEKENISAQKEVAGGILLNEISFFPAEGETAYIEVINVGSDLRSLNNFKLENEKGEIIFFPEGLVLESSKVLLIRFDESEDVEAGVLYLPDTGFLDAASGQLMLYGEDDQLLDKISWGSNQPETIKMGAGGIQQDPDPGSSIGRSPGTKQFTRWDWALYPGDETSPGRTNPMPSVQVVQPLNGALLPSTIVQLMWYPVAGADQYRLQIARNTSFTNLAMDEVTSFAVKYTNPLAAGIYYWRVQAISADGNDSAYSPSQSFQIQVEEEKKGEHEKLMLDVPILYQHKDSYMLMLESHHLQGSNAWNRPHEGYDPNEPAHVSNNPLAVLAMLNHFYGGDITQDRLGYQIFKDRSQGPELDLAYGIGPTMEQIDYLFSFTFEGAVSQWQGGDPKNYEQHVQFVSFVRNSIAAGNPVMAYTPGHFVLINGYETIDDQLLFWIVDPAAGIYRVYAHEPTWLSAFSFTDPVAAKLEDSLLIDSDGDGILDFDESERFHTDVFKADSDSDGISDLTEIQASALDPEYGYGLHPHSNARDIDLDGLTMEFDIDSDNGGCIDSFEDFDRNGKYSPQFETSNFDPGDDSCFALEMTWSYHDDWGNSTVRWIGSLGMDNRNNVSGTGVVILSHNGTCTDSEMLTTFTIQGKLVDQFDLKIKHEETFEISTFSTEELKPDCTLAMGIEENWVISHGIYSGIPEDIIVPIPPSNQTSVVDLFTHPDAPRRGSIILTLKNLQDQN